MNDEEFRVIPGYQGYAVTKAGVVKSLERDLVLGQYLLDGYLIVDTFRGSLTETLPVHRAVALAWVRNPNPEQFTIVNHIDSNILNNWWGNLEWTDYSGNAYHAIANGLRPDNINCRVRDFYTKVVHPFPSIAQAAEFMGLRKDTPMFVLRPKKFGALVSNRYEFRFADDPTPWFYESRTERVTPPSRYMVTVKESDGTEREIFSKRVLLKDYQLYGSPSKAMPALAAYGNAIYPDKQFTVRDGYAEEPYRVSRQTKPSLTVPVVAMRGIERIEFRSLTECADYFSVARFSIVVRMKSGRDLDGWTFAQLSL
jgi:hypothetical protein